MLKNKKTKIIIKHVHNTVHTLNAMAESGHLGSNRI